MTKPLFKQDKTGENVQIKVIFYLNIHPKYGLEMEFTACTSSWCQRERWHQFTVCDTYRYFV